MTKIKIAYREQTDVLIIGMGGAGIKAALKAGAAGADVLMVGSDGFARSGATFYPGTPGWGMQAIVHPGDSEDYFYEEIIVAGAGLADPQLAKILVENCTLAFRELEEYGIRFSQNEKGEYLSVIPCFGKRMRGGSALGIEKIGRVLYDQLQKANIAIRENVEIIRLIKQGDQVVGALALDQADQLFFIEARAVIMASGGASRLYRYALATAETIGTGYALALTAEAALTNLEMIQFIPGLVWPVKGVLFQEKNLDTQPLVLNRQGEDILEQYLPPGISREQCLNERAKHGPFTTTDTSFYFDVSLYEEIRKNNALPSGGIHLQYPEKITQDQRWVMTSWLSWMHKLGVDPVRQGFDLVPHAQCFNGGIAIDSHCRTGVNGLYAAGEVAGGPHGADRLGGAAIAATQVFGAIAGQAAAGFALAQKRSDLNDSRIIAQLRANQAGLNGDLLPLTLVYDTVQQVLWDNAAIVRSKERCTDGLKVLAGLRQDFDPLAYWPDPVNRKRAFQCETALTVAGALLESIMLRAESRGPHFRLDARKQNPEMARPLQVRLVDGKLDVNFKRI